MNYIRCGMAQAKLTRIALRLRRESAINNNSLGIWFEINSLDIFLFCINLNNIINVMSSCAFAKLHSKSRWGSMHKLSIKIVYVCGATY